MDAVNSELIILDEPPAGLFTIPAQELQSHLGGPALVSIQGEMDPPLFLSVLLHGNETSGWEALCEVMQALGPHQRPGRSILLFIGNVAAAAKGVRTLPGQTDFNRIWYGENESSQLVATVLQQLRAQPLFAALDIHNNTGRNPHYSVLTQVDEYTCGLAYLFSDKAVLVEEPDSVLTRAVAPLCPAVTVEVGPVGDALSVARTTTLLRRYLDLETVPMESPETLVLHRAIARVHVREGVQFDFADEASAEQLDRDDLVLTAGMEAVNFHPVLAGTQFGFARRPLSQCLQVLDPQHRDVTAQFFDEIHGDISLRRPVIPAMYTLDHTVVLQDCLCYFMEHIDA